MSNVFGKFFLIVNDSHAHICSVDANHRDMFSLFIIIPLPLYTL